MKKAFIPLVVAVLGVSVGWLLVSGDNRWLIAVGVVILALGWAARRKASGMLPAEPVKARRLFEWSLLFPATLAVSATAFILWLAISTELPKDAPAIDSKAVGALVGAVTTAITAVFIKDAESADDSWVAGAMKAAFRSAYGESGPALSDTLTNRIFTDTGLADWGRAGRGELARDIQAYLNAPGLGV